jgi:hypothetical protein
MGFETAFAPHYTTNQRITANITSQSISLNADDKAVRLVNDGIYTVYIRIGFGAQTATVSDMPLLADDSIVLYKGYGADTLACLCPEGPALLHVQTGDGGG